MRGGQKIAFFAGDLDNFGFAGPIISYLRQSGYVTELYKQAELNEQLLQKIESECSLIWCEWGNGPVIPISRYVKNTPVILRVHRYEVYEESITQIHWKNISSVVFINNEFVDVAKRLWNLDIAKQCRVDIIPNPVSENLVFRERNNNYHVAYVSRFQKDKNPAFMIQILKKLVDKDERYHLSMVGRKQDEQLYDYCMHLIRALGLEAHFSYDGIVGDINGWLEDKSFLLSTSIVESQSLAIMEAMMMGIKPIIHNSFGRLEQFYSSDLFFNTADEAVALITEQKYDSNFYKAQISSTYSANVILPRIESLVSETIGVQGKQTSGAGQRITVPETNPSPLISVCVPNYNYSAYLTEAIDSILAQTYQNIEVIICDDGSTDNSLDVLKQFEGNEKVRVIAKEHSGAPDTRNRLISEAGGEWILWHDADDVLDKNIITQYLQTLKQYPDVDTLYCSLESIGDETGVFHTYNDWYGRIDDAFRFLLMGNPIPNPGNMTRRKRYEKQRYDTAFPRAHDYELWSRLLEDKNYKAKYIPLVLCKYRIHAKNISGRMKDHIDTSYDAKIIKRVLQKRDLQFFFPQFDWYTNPAQATDAAYLQLTMKFLQLKDTVTAVEYIEKIRDAAIREKLRPFVTRIQQKA